MRQITNSLVRITDYINRMVNGRTSVTPEMAVKLGSAFRTTSRFWLNAQEAVDLYKAERKLGKHLPKPLVEEH
ncbi:MAG: HigA family addiction module antidote protein [Acidobacteria bacterium]|nr:HigA family addiction module antidote protein [Acidobacteriota bacterium]